MSLGVADPRATALLDQWSRLAMRHVALGAACACGMGGVSLRLDDFEVDIVGYLEDVGSRSGIAAVEAFFAASGAASARAQPLKRLLEDAQDGRIDAAVTDWLMARLERTLGSFAALHGPRGA